MNCPAVDCHEFEQVILQSEDRMMIASTWSKLIVPIGRTPLTACRANNVDPQKWLSYVCTGGKIGLRRENGLTSLLLRVPSLEAGTSQLGILKELRHVSLVNSKW